MGSKIKFSIFRITDNKKWQGDDTYKEKPFTVTKKEEEITNNKKSKGEN